MTTVEEKSFPRGGKKSEDVQNLKRKNDSLGFVQSAPSKKVRLSQYRGVTEITVKTISEGMVLLGCVREVNELELKINLPGGIIGYAPAINISKEYSTYLKTLISGEETEPVELNHIFKPGQFVITKVEEISPLPDEKTKVVLTLNPKAILVGMSHNDIVKGLTIPVSVQSIEDHGYIMNCGIRGVRAFLKKSRATKFEEIWNDGRNLAVGQIVRCLVVKCSTSEECSNVELDADPQTIADTLAKADTPLKCVIPGMCFQMIVCKISINGLVVKFTDRQYGFIDLRHLDLDLSKIEKGAEIKGKVLYIEPLTKNVFLSALDNVCGSHPLPDPFQKLRKGKVLLQATVTHVRGGHLILELRKDSGLYGYVTARHLNVHLDDDTDVALNEQVKKAYPIGSQLKCRVLEYDYLSQKYSCTLNKKILELKYSSLDEISPGTVTICSVEKSTPREIILTVGAIRGFVEPMHCTDVPVRFADTLLTKGQKVKARVLTVKSPVCEFTLKPTLVNSQTPILTGFSDAKYDVPYEGVIVAINRKGIVVKFYGDFRCFAPVSRISEGKEGQLENTYYTGQVVICYVKEIHADEQRLTISVQPCSINEIVKVREAEEGLSYKDENCFFKVGRPYTVIVNDITSDGLIVKELASGISGSIPRTQLTDYPLIAELLCQTYKKGDKLNAYCLNGKNNPLFTISPTFIKYFESRNGKRITKNGVSFVKENMILPSTIYDINNEGITVAIPTQERDILVSVSRVRICDGTVHEVSALDIQLRQTLMVHLDHVFRGVSAEGRTRLSKVWDKTSVTETGVMLLQDYLKCHKRIHDFLRSEDHPLGKLEIGSRVKGTVGVVTSIGIVVHLENGARGVVMPAHYRDVQLRENMSIEGTVIFVDLVNQCAEISLSQEVANRLSSLSEPPHIGKCAKSVVYVSRVDVVIAAIKHFNRVNLVYIPSRWHINDLRPSPYFEVGEHGKIRVTAYEDKLTFAVPRKVVVLERKSKGMTRQNYIFNDTNANVNGTDDSVQEKNDSQDWLQGDFVSLATVNSSKSIIKKKKQKIEENNINGNKQVSGNEIEVSFSELNDDSVSLKRKITLKNEIKEKRKNRNSLQDNIEEGNMNGRDNQVSGNEIKETFSELNEDSACLEEECTSKTEVKKKKEKNRKDIKDNKEKCKKNIQSNVEECNGNYKDQQVITNEVEDSFSWSNNDLVSLERKSPKTGIKENRKIKYNIQGHVEESNMNDMNKQISGNEIKETFSELNDNSVRLKKKGVLKNEIKKKKENRNIGESVEENNVNEEKHAPESTFEASSGHIDLNINSADSCDESSLISVQGKSENLNEKFSESEKSDDLCKSKGGKISEKTDKKQSSAWEVSDMSVGSGQNKIASSIATSSKKTGNNETDKRKSNIDKSLSEDKSATVIEHSSGLQVKGKGKDEKKLQKTEQKNSRCSAPLETFKSSVPTTEKTQKCLNVSAGFVWDATPDQLPAVIKQKAMAAESSSEEEPEETMNKKKKQRLSIAEKRALARQEEERLRKLEERLMDAERNPQTADDFDRLVMSDPNNSQNWIKYIAFHVQSTEIAKARAIGERALKTISFREEQEKLNVWMAILNLENLYGTQESLEKTLDEAVKMNDSYKVHMQVLNMYSTTRKIEDLDKLMQLVTKKYKNNRNTWIEAGIACMTCGEIEKSRQLMQRALKILDKRDHVEILSRFARMENEWGETERAETIMEKILTSYPKRADVWSVYVDMLVKSKKIDIARQVLDRAVIQKFRPGKMKSLFKKYLKFEHDHGTPEGVEKVREMAKGYVENISSSNTD